MFSVECFKYYAGRRIPEEIARQLRVQYLFAR